MEEKEKKNIEIVNGDGSNLDISPVYDHLNVSTPKDDEDKPKNIVIPISQKEDQNASNNEKKDEESDEK